MAPLLHISDGGGGRELRQHLLRLNACLFPVKYKENYYRDALVAGDYTKLAFWDEACVGNIACRLEHDEDAGTVKLYIMTLGVLPTYRRKGIGSKLLKSVLSMGQQDPKVVEIYLHVQMNNEEALSFYQAHGFKIVDAIYNYYLHLQPPDCYVLSRRLK